jgi:hypothetical protein
MLWLSWNPASNNTPNTTTNKSRHSRVVLRCRPPHLLLIVVSKPTHDTRRRMRTSLNTHHCGSGQGNVQMASTLPWRLVNVCARLLRRLGGLRWPSWCPKAPKRCDECARFRWCDGSDENSVHRLRKALKIVGNGRWGHCRGCAIAGWCWSGGWLLTNWVLEMGYFCHRRSRFEVI